MRARDLKTEFKCFKGQPVEILTENVRFCGIEIDSDDESVEIIDSCNRVIFLPFRHIDAVIKPKMKLTRFCADNDCNCEDDDERRGRRHDCDEDERRGCRRDRDDDECRGRRHDRDDDECRGRRHDRDDDECRGRRHDRDDDECRGRRHDRDDDECRGQKRDRDDEYDTWWADSY